eukprot:TsM_001125400 transcript=TsM_001125400 gene=TsM_001125400
MGTALKISTLGITMSTEVSDDTCLTEESSVCDRTFELPDATFPSLTPVIDRKEVNFEQLSLAGLEVSSSFTKATPPRERRKVSKTLFHTPAPTASSYPIATPDIVNGRVSSKRGIFSHLVCIYTSPSLPHLSSSLTALPKTIPLPSVAAAKGESAFYRRKAYDEARRKTSLPIARVDPRRRASIAATAVAGRERVGAAALRASKRAEARRQAMDKNRRGLPS